MGKLITGSPDWCWICGLPILRNIASRTHPLFFTVDHVVPKVSGGTSAPRNLRPSHYLCNQTKGSKAVEEVDRVGLQAEILPLLNRYMKTPVSAGTRKRARLRIGSLAA